MPLPSLIELVPLDRRVTASITVPGSKSITNRALILGAFAEGETTLRGALWSEDTQVMVECLQELGFMVNVAADRLEPCNRTITLYGKGGQVPPGGTPAQPLELFVGNAGTAARFLTAFVCLGQGTYKLHGIPRMHQRPQGALFQALRSLGYQVDSPTDTLPAVVHGAGPRPGKCQVSIEASSQFASALLLSAAAGGWQVQIAGENAEEASYVSMTSKIIKVFPRTGGVFQVEPDASSGSYFLAASRLALVPLKQMESSHQLASEIETPPAGTVSVANWPNSGWQIDQSFPEVLTRALRGEVTISREKDLGDSIMTAIVAAPFAAAPAKFSDLGRLRVQECERVAALKTELAKCGARVIESGDRLEVFPSELHGAEIETYEDHRVAMCFAILGLKVPAIRIKNPGCVKKTFPNFFQKLAGAPPAGLGARILDARTQQVLGFEELFAD